MNAHDPFIKAELALLHYGDGEYAVLKPGKFVLCAVSGAKIPLEALRSPEHKISIPPLHGALLKNEQDMHLFERLVFMDKRSR